MGWSADLPPLFYPAMVLRNRRRRPLRVVIVERQNHALEHVHHALRRAASLTGGWTMVHFDSHPDLACPDPAHLCARACFEPRTDRAPAGGGPARDLYDSLDASVSGIAEWIVPLQLAGGARHRGLAETSVVRPVCGRGVPVRGGGGGDVRCGGG